MDPVTRDAWARPRLVGLVALAGAATALLLLRSTPAWRAVQGRYRADRASFEIGLRTAAGEHCATCHLAGAGYEPLAEAPFQAHPEVGHDPLELGCTPCHGGDAASLALHDRAAFGRDPPLPGWLAWAACLRCHDPADGELDPWPQVAAFRGVLGEAFDGAGCAACHRLVGRGGLVGPDLTAFGATPVSDPTAPWAGRFEQASLQIEDPGAAQPAPRMPTPDLDLVEREALAAWLSLAGRAAAPTAWDPVAPEPDGGQGGAVVFARFCSPCHGAEGEGRERGRPPGAVPALASPLWLTYAPPDLVRHAVREGRDGSQMEGFRAEGAAPILTDGEVEAVLDLVLGGRLDPTPDAVERDRVAAGACATCHPLRADHLAGRGDAGRAAYQVEHPWRWTLADWEADEGFAHGDCAEDLALKDGTHARVHAGERLYGTLCVGCHEDPKRAPAAQEPSAPALRGALRRPHFDAGYLLASVVLGRSDAAPVKWRHQGVLAAEYTPRRLACLAAWLEEQP